MPTSDQKTFKDFFFGAPSFWKAAYSWRPELYIIVAAFAFLAWLIPSLQRFFFHWPMCIGIGVIGLIVKEIERRKNPPAATPEHVEAPAPPMILQRLQDSTSCAFLVLPLVVAAAIVSPTMDPMISATLEVAFPLLNFHAVTSLCCWLVYRLTYGR